MSCAQPVASRPLATAPPSRTTGTRLIRCRAKRSAISGTLASSPRGDYARHHQIARTPVVNPNVIDKLRANQVRFIEFSAPNGSIRSPSLIMPITRPHSSHTGAALIS